MLTKRISWEFTARLNLNAEESSVTAALYGNNFTFYFSDSIKEASTLSMKKGHLMPFTSQNLLSLAHSEYTLKAKLNNS